MEQLAIYKQALKDALSVIGLLIVQSEVGRKWDEKPEILARVDEVTLRLEALVRQEVPDERNP